MLSILGIIILAVAIQFLMNIYISKTQYNYNHNFDLYIAPIIYIVFYVYTNANWTDYLLLNLLIMATMVDIEHKLVPHRILLAIFLLSTINIYYIWDDFILKYSLISIVVLFILFFISNGAIGGGDIKLFMIFAIYFAVHNFVFIILLSSIIAGITNIFIMLQKRITRKEAIAFVPFITIGTYITLLFM